MLTYLMRHGRTGYSAEYRINGRPDVVIPLDDKGREQCRLARATFPVDTIATCVVSQLGRTSQTAELILAGRAVPVVVESRLDEIDYGEFEGGPFLAYGSWLRAHSPLHRPPGARESQREAIVRMLHGLLGALEYPGPRLVVGHGLLLSFVRTAHAGQLLTSAFFPEAPYVTPMTFTDAALATFVRDALNKINGVGSAPSPPEGRESRRKGKVDLARFNAAEPLEADLSEGLERHA